MADFSGPQGGNGLDGPDGRDGHAADIHVDPDTGAMHQGSGGNGEDGTNGGDGGEGAPGEALHVWVHLDPATRQLQIKVASATHQSLYRVDRAGGSLRVLADGGAGGRACSGGRGGRGGVGGGGSPPGLPGLDGHGGMDGRPGRPGPAGTTIASVDPAARPCMGCLVLLNRNGAGKAGIPPTITEEPVAALW